MITVVKPSKNPITQQFSSAHPGYDFSGKGDPYAYCSQDGAVTACIGSYSKNWLQGHPEDPTPIKLTTEDYGNYIRIAHKDGSAELHAHLEPFTESEYLNKSFKAGDKIGKIGHTGNSTARHLHYEYIGVGKSRIQVNFIDAPESPMTENDISIPKKTFEDLVTKATKFDEISSTGISTKSDVENLKRLIEESKQQAGKAEEEARSTRESFTQFRQKVAEKLGSPQDLDRVLSSIDEILRQLSLATNNAQVDGKENVKYELQIASLRAEVEKYKLLLANKNVLENVNFEELLKEIVRRFTNILKRTP